MKSMVLTGLNKLKIIEKPIPEIQDEKEVLIRMKSVGICGSDIHYYKEGKIGSQIVKYPFTIGHEGSGIIEKVGSEVDFLKAGDRVAVDPLMPCYVCQQCLTGRFHTCLRQKFLGCPGQAEGCLSEYIVMPERSCYKISDNMTLDQASLSEPLAIGLYAVKLAGLFKGVKVGILGSGPIGISVLLTSKAKGASKVYVTDLIDSRLKLASEMGAHWTGNPEKEDIIKEIQSSEPELLDVVFDCCGKQEAADQAISLLKPGGKFMIVGIPSFSNWSFSVEKLRRKELSIHNVRRQNETVQETLDMISSGEINPDRMLTHTFEFKDLAKAFDLVAGYKDGVMKAMVHI